MAFMVRRPRQWNQPVPMSLHGESLPAPSARASGQQRIRLNVLFGIPDDGAGIVRVAPGGRAVVTNTPGTGSSSFVLRGSANLAPFLSRERFALDRIYVQGDEPPIRLGPGAILNHIADPDICSRALAEVAQIAESSRRPCFNHPAAIARTTRDGVAQMLSGIPGLTVPKTIRVAQSSPAHVRGAASDAGMRYPILVRVVGSHGGQDRVKIDTPESMGDIAQLQREGLPLFLTEFYDFVSPDGLYRKFRIVVVGEEILVRQCVIGSDWSLHGRHRAEIMDEEEEHVFNTFQSEWEPSLKPVFSEIIRRIDLDYFGVDCHIDQAKNVLLFEANACMKVLKNYKPLPNRFEAPIARIMTAVQARLAAPDTWRHTRRPA
jgi:glutathione synthase/RimK-type ligase-like ATP-grasp enzyme